MKIVHFVENLERGGLERAVIDLIGAQREAGHECSVICLFEQGALAGELIAQGVPVAVCGKHNGIDLAALRRARRLLKQTPGAVLHSHNPVAHYYAAAASIGLPMRRIVNTRHSMGTGRTGKRTEWLYRRSMRVTDDVAGVCEAARVHFSALGMRPRSSLVSIPNGIRLERFDRADAAARRDLVQELGLPERSKLIGTVGRLQPVKDQHNLLDAFALVRELVPSAALVVIGSGPLREGLESHAHERGISGSVRFLGDRSDVPRLLQGLDIFALSSISEGYSVALLEACAAGLPIVATDVGGNHEIVRDGINGLLVPARSATRLAEALTSLLQDPGRMEGMGAAGRKWAVAEASFRTMAQRYLSLYQGRFCDISPTQAQAVRCPPASEITPSGTMEQRIPFSSPTPTTSSK